MNIWSRKIKGILLIIRMFSMLKSRHFYSVNNAIALILFNKSLEYVMITMNDVSGKITGKKEQA